MKYSQNSQWKQVSCLQNIATCLKCSFLCYVNILSIHMNKIAEKKTKEQSHWVCFLMKWKIFEMNSKIVKNPNKTTNSVLWVIGFSLTVLKRYYVKTNVSVIAGIRKIKKLWLLQIQLREMVV